MHSKIYKVWDKVRIRKDLVLERYFSERWWTDCVTPSMKELAWQVVIIDNDYWKWLYWIKNGSRRRTDSMFEPYLSYDL